MTSINLRGPFLCGLDWWQTLLDTCFKSHKYSRVNFTIINMKFYCWNCGNLRSGQYHFHQMFFDILCHTKLTKLKLIPCSYTISFSIHGAKIQFTVLKLPVHNAVCNFFRNKSLFSKSKCGNLSLIPKIGKSFVLGHFQGLLGQCSTILVLLLQWSFY